MDIKWIYFKSIMDIKYICVLFRIISCLKENMKVLSCKILYLKKIPYSKTKSNAIKNILQ